jgi:hypothetical protein
MGEEAMTDEQRDQAIAAIRQQHPRLYPKFAGQIIDALVAIGWGPR